MSYSAAQQRRPGNSGGGGGGRQRQRQRGLGGFGATTASPSGVISRSSDMASWQLLGTSPSPESPLPNPYAAAGAGGDRSRGVPHEATGYLGQEAGVTLTPRQRMGGVRSSEGEEEDSLMPGSQLRAGGATQMPPWLSPSPGMHEPEARRSADPRMHSLLQRPSNLPGGSWPVSWGVHIS